VGPIGVLCIRRTLADGRAAGLVSGLGAATADAFYGFVAGFGLTFISNFLLDQQVGLRLIGGAFLCYLGVRTLLSRPANKEAETTLKRGGLVGHYLSTVLLTITNPLTIFSFAAVFAGLGVGGTGSNDYLSATILVLGVFSGSALWWLLLSGGVSLFRNRFRPPCLLWVNRLSGAFITFAGVLSLFSVLKR
jgi:threonine/homoserine/homoserine lactone efflux protein